MGEESTSADVEAPEEPGRSRAILVVGTEEGFSSMLVDYALGLAGRMGYSIVALNLLEADKREMRRYHGETGKRELETMQKMAQAAAEDFGGKAWARKVAFKSEWTMGELDKCAQDILAREGNIELALTEPEYFGDSDGEYKSIPTFMYSE
ncbi:MAG: hypothetical protein OEZ32_01225 [Nitrospinota bacterium]|nr:hypothetical protein [Nitrospinota bacterium]